jgi:hypothetical protein
MIAEHLEPRILLSFAAQAGNVLDVTLDSTGAVTLGMSGNELTASQSSTVSTFTGITSIAVTDSAANDVLDFSGPILMPVGFSSTSTAIVNVDSGTLFFLKPSGGSISLGELTIANGAEAILPTATSSQMQLNIGSSLSIGSTGILDITNNRMVIDYGGSDPISTIVGYLVAGRDGGSWNGSGGILSSTAAEDTSSYGLGYADGANGVVSGLSAGQIEVRYTLLGDANLDANVNGSDYFILAAHYNQSVTNGWDKGDFNYDGHVNGTDSTLMSENFNDGADITSSQVTDDTPTSPVPGMNYSYYEGDWTDLPDFGTLTPIKGGLASDFSLAPRNSDQQFGFDFNGYVNIPTSGPITFSTTSADGSDLYVDGTLVVSNDGVHSSATESGTIGLQAGLHAIEVQYFQNSNGPQLQVDFSGAGFGETVIPDSSLFGIQPASVDVSTYGAVGNGTTNDSASIQAAIDAAPDYSTLVFDSGKTYLLGAGLVIDKPINIEGNNAELLLDTSANPENEEIFYAGAVSSSDVFNWNEDVSASAPGTTTTTFDVSIPTSQLLPGDAVWLALGTDPNDATQPNFETICTVVANTGSSVTVNTAIPYDINEMSSGNSIRRITGLIQNTSIQDLQFNFVSGTVPDSNIWIQAARNVLVNNISGTFTIAVQLLNAQNITVTNVTGNLIEPTSSQGRAISATQTDGLTASNINVTQSNDTAVVFLESWTRNTSINDITVAWTYGSPSGSAVFDVTGNSYNTFIDNATIDNEDAGAINLFASGDQAGECSFGTVTVTGPIESAPLTQIADLIDDGVTYDSSETVTETQTISIGANWSSGEEIPLVSGAIQSITFDSSTLEGVTAVYLENSGNEGSQLIDNGLVAGDVTFAQFIGTNYPLNDVSYPGKDLYIYTNGSVMPGTTLVVTVTYYPMS